MESQKRVTVGTAARLAGVSVRTLHHYDDLGLVAPVRRTDGGYRLYGRREIERLQEVLFFRELGFSLVQIREIITSGRYGRASALARQRRLLEAKADRLLMMVESIDAAIDAEQRGIVMTNEEMLEVFGDFDPSEFENEVRDRWETAMPTNNRFAARRVTRPATGRTSDVRAPRSTARSFS